MARKKFIRLSSKQREKYKQALQGLKDVRTIIKEQHRYAMISFLDLPANSKRQPTILALPREHTKHMFTSQKEYRKEMKTIKRYSNVNKYFNVYYKRRILDVLKEKINDTNITINGKELKPEQRFGFFSEEQIDNQTDKRMKEYMSMYNEMNAWSSYDFFRAYSEGFVIPIRYIYGEMDTYGRTANASSYHLEHQKDLLDELKGTGRVNEK